MVLLMVALLLVEIVDTRCRVTWNMYLWNKDTIGGEVPIC